LIAKIHEALGNVGEPQPEPEPERPKAAVSVKKSLGHDHLICLEDGLQFKSLKRHLKSHHNLTPEEYRQRWNLAADYPMVAPAYAERRSKLAKDIGLGQKRRKK
jgi:predicted transcriptional regulator